ncbi:MAG: succinylglutamate desuccinylase/aspartoacylase family protein [Actinomycetota bacterium]|nr:succinylglutamate desuccinylase/aspartoacylase family protein [Actinomycetota bacterium]
MSAPKIEVDGELVDEGTRVDTDLRLARLPSGALMTVPLVALRGVRDGPVVWLTAAIHGDELNGVEIVRQLLGRLDPADMAGGVLAIPIANVFGFGTGDRYLPDRRDLNRSFPGNDSGSLAARIAHLIITNLVEQSDLGIDLHTGSDGRSNLPQIRADLDDPETAELARVFGAPLMLHSRLRDGSLREAAWRMDKRVLLYEAGEALRFDRRAIDTGVAGVLRVLAHLGIVDASLATPAQVEPLVSRRSTWTRSPRSGIHRPSVELGDHVRRRQIIGRVGDAFGAEDRPVRAGCHGMVIGRSETPAVHRGDAIFHIAELEPDPPPA